MLASVLAPVLAVTLTPGVLRTGLVLAVVSIRLALTTLPPSPAFALAVRLTTEALLGNLRARPKTRPAGCTLPALHGSPPGRIAPSCHAPFVRSKSMEDQYRTGGCAPVILVLAEDKL
jgi:hypothetical protein